MSAGITSIKTLATLGEIARRVRVALNRHPLCRALEFDVLPTLRNGNGANWTVMFRSGGVELDDAEDIVRDIQDAYQLEAGTLDLAAGPLRWVERGRRNRLAAGQTNG